MKISAAPAGFDSGRVGNLAVSIQGLHRSFGERNVLNGLDLTIASAEFVALLGASGSGKSTLLKVMGGFDGEVTGRVEVAVRRSIVFQEPRLLPWSRVLRNVTLGLRTTDVKERGLAALAEVGLAGRERQWPLTLSGGEAQRVALARALVREPDLMLLDEPFGALDALTRVKMHALLRQLCARHEPAVLFVTHDVDEAIALADRILVLKEGRIRTDVTVDIPGSRSQSEHRFLRLRSTLLSELGVADDISGLQADPDMRRNSGQPSGGPPNMTIRS